MLTQKPSKKHFFKYIFWTLSVLVFVILFLIILGYVYLKEIETFLLKELAKNIKADIKIDYIDVSFWKSWPEMRVQVHKITLNPNKAENKKNNFKPIPLFKAEDLYLYFNFWKFWAGKYQVTQLKIENSELNLQQNDKLVWNYDLIPKKSKKPEKSSDLEFQVSLFQILKSKFSISSAKFNLATEKTDLDLVGKMNSNKIEANVIGNCLLATYTSNNKTWVQKLDLKFETSFLFNLKNNDFSFQKNKIKISQFEIDLAGTFEQKSKILQWDLAFSSKNNKIEQIISFLPDKIQKRLFDMKVEAEFETKGMWKGIFKNDTPPPLELFIQINKGSLIDSTLGQLSNINCKANLNFFNNSDTIINVQKLNGIYKNKPIKGSFLITSPKKPLLEFELKTENDLALLQYFLPKSQNKFNGNFDLDLDFKAFLEDLENKNFSQIVTKGNLKLDNCNFHFVEENLQLSDFQANLNFNRDKILISSLNGKVNTSDFKATGNIENYWAYIFGKNQNVNILAQVSSQYLVLDEFIQQNTKSKPSENIELKFPENIVFQTHIEVKNFNLRKLKGKNLSSNLVIENQKIYFEETSFQVFDGKIETNGVFETHPKPSLEADFAISKINIHDFFNTFEQFDSVSVVKDKIFGIFSAQAYLKTFFDKNFQMSLPSLELSTSYSFQEGKLINFEPMKKIAKFIRLEKYNDLKFNDIQSKINIKNQTVEIEKMLINANNLKMIIAGKHTFEQKLDYKLQWILSKTEIENKQNNDWILEENVEPGMTSLFLKIKGTVSEPIVSWDFEATKAKVKQSFQKEKNELKNAFEIEKSKWKKDKKPKPKKESWVDEVE